MKLKLSLALVLSAILPLTAYAAPAADPLAPIKKAVPLYEGFKAAPLAEAKKLLTEMSGDVGALPKDFVSFIGYDEDLFSAFGKLPAKRTQTAEFTACTGVGEMPLYTKRITKGAASSLDYRADGFTDAERAALEKEDSRVLHYVELTFAGQKTRAGATQYLDFNKPSAAHPAPSDGVNLRIGTLAKSSLPQVGITQCAKPLVADAIFPNEILRDAAVTGKTVQMEDKQGVLWFVRKGATPGKWVVNGPQHLSAKNAVAMFEKNLAARVKNGHQPWHVSRTETFKGTSAVQRIQFAKFDYDNGRSETMTLLVADGKARLGWSISDKDPQLSALNALPPVPPTEPKKSFEDYISTFSASGQAALRLMQVAFECPDSAVAKKIDKDTVSSLVLFETLGASRLSNAQMKTMPQDKFEAMVIEGVEKLKSVDSTDVTDAVDCTVGDKQVEAWTAQAETKRPDFVQFMKRLGTISN
jgi:hypothetical protein